MMLLYTDYAFVGSFAGHMDVILGGFEIVSVAMVWLAFSPPASYRQWIVRPADRQRVEAQQRAFGAAVGARRRGAPHQTKSLILLARRVIFRPFGEVAEWLKALPC